MVECVRASPPARTKGDPVRISRWSVALAGAVAAASLSTSVWLLSSTVHAPTTDTGQGTSCGSIFEVVRDGSAYQGGDYREDQEAFDAACVQHAGPRLHGAIASGALGLLAASYFLGSVAIIVRRQSVSRAER